MTASTKNRSVAEQVRRRVLALRDRLWRVEDFEDLEDAEGSASAVNNELRRLVARGDLVRVRRGVYWRGKKSRFGMLAVPAADALRKSIGDDEAVGATGWHATNLLGLSTQVSPVETFAVSHRIPEGMTKVKVSSRAARHGRRDAHLNGMEVTILEALEGWDRYVEADSKTALKRFSKLLGREDVRVERLVKASRTEPPVVRERLRAVLRDAGHGTSADRVRRARDPRTRVRALRVLPMKLLREERTDFEGAISRASEELGLAQLFVEKDYWVTQVLRALHEAIPERSSSRAGRRSRRVTG